MTQSSFARSFISLGSANVVSMGAQLVSMLALGVFAAPQELGKFLLGLAIAAPFATFSALRFDSAIPSARTRGECYALLVLALGSTVATTGVAVLIICWVRSIDLFSLAALSPAAIVAIVGIMLATALGQAGRYMAIRTANLRPIARATYGRGILTLLLRGLAIAAMLNGTLAVAWQATYFLMCELACVAIAAVILRPRGLRRAQLIQTRRLRAVARRNWKFPLVEGPSTMLDTFSANAPIYLVTQFFGLGPAGSFGLAFRAMAAPAGQLSLAMTEILQSRYSALLRAGDISSVRSMFLKSSAMALGVGGIGYVIALALFEPVVVFALGERMRSFAQVSVAILPWVVLLIVVNLNSRVIALFRRQELKLIYDLYSLAAVGALTIAGTAFAPAFLTFVGWIAITQVIGYLIYWLLMFRLFRVRS
jgi:O-antigen/teichoic acid export membrane protein